MFTCPRCIQTTCEYFNVGRAHFALCHHCRVYFFAASNLFSSWKEQTEEEQRQIHFMWTEEEEYEYVGDDNDS